MKLIVTEKDSAARKIAEILGGKVAVKEHGRGRQKVKSYHFTYDGDDAVAIGLRGHVMETVFPNTYRRWSLKYLGDMIERAGPRLGRGRRRRRHARRAAHRRQGRRPRSSSPPTTTARASSSATRRSRSCAATRSSATRTTSRRRRRKAGAAGRAQGRGRPAGPSRTTATRRSRPCCRRPSSTGTPRALLGPHAGGGQGRLRQAVHRRLQPRRGGALAAGHRPHLGRRAHALHVAGLVPLRLGLPVGRARADADAAPASSTASSSAAPSCRCRTGRSRPTLEHDGEPFEVAHAKGRFDTLEAMETALARARSRRRPRSRPTRRSRARYKPPAPFNTTALMSAASGVGMTPARAMRAAESLYLDGLISYPRTDNTVYPPSLDLHGSLSAARAAGRRSPPRRRGSPARTSSRRRAARSAPPTTRRSTRSACPKKELSGDQAKVYDLVARRFLATLLPAAVDRGPAPRRAPRQRAVPGARQPRRRRSATSRSTRSTRPSATGRCRRCSRATRSGARRARGGQGDAAAGPLRPGHAHREDGGARPGHQGHARRHHPAPLRPQLRARQPGGAHRARRGAHRRLRRRHEGGAGRHLLERR